MYYVDEVDKDVSMFAQHILNTGHAYGCIEDIMKILHTISKGAHMNTLEKFHIYEMTKQGMQLNYTFMDIDQSHFQYLNKSQ
jgi:hypothetical protein